MYWFEYLYKLVQIIGQCLTVDKLWRSSIFNFPTNGCKTSPVVENVHNIFSNVLKAKPLSQG